MATKKAATTKSRKAPARRSVSAKPRKPAGGLTARRKPAAAERPRFMDLSFTAMLAEIFGMRMQKADPPSRKSARQ